MCIKMIYNITTITKNIFQCQLQISTMQKPQLRFHQHKKRKQGDNIQPQHTPFPILNPVHCFMFGSSCCFLICIQDFQDSGKVVWYSYL